MSTNSDYFLSKMAKLSINFIWLKQRGITMRIPENHNDKYTLNIWKRRDKKVQKSFEEELKESINKGKSKVIKQLQKNILDTII